MLELSSIAEFSRCHCIGICAFLVPTNLGLAIATMLFTALNRSPRTIHTTIGLGILPAIVLLLHVVTWWSIGVVMLPTFILPMLAITCLAIYAYALFKPGHMRNLLLTISKISIAKYQQLLAN
jgi:hypothetical protein